jgi:phi13 family phage major tail protein
MAKKGFEYAVVGKYSEETGKHTDGKYLGPTSTFNITTTSNDVKDYGDNRAVVTDTSVTGGTTSVEINEMVNELYAYMLGHTYNSEENTVVCNKDDIAPFIGMGAVGISRAEDNKDKYTAKFYKKCQMKEPNDENATQAETLTFTHTTLEGNMFVPEDGNWKEQKTFATLKEAKTWLNEKVGITASDAGATNPKGQE